MCTQRGDCQRQLIVDFPPPHDNKWFIAIFLQQCLVSDQFLYSRDLNVRFRDDIKRRNEMWSLIGSIFDSSRLD